MQEPSGGEVVVEEAGGPRLDEPGLHGDPADAVVVGGGRTRRADGAIGAQGLRWGGVASGRHVEPLGPNTSAGGLGVPARPGDEQAGLGRSRSATGRFRCKYTCGGDVRSGRPWSRRCDGRSGTRGWDHLLLRWGSS